MSGFSDSTLNSKAKYLQERMVAVNFETAKFYIKFCDFAKRWVGGFRGSRLCEFIISTKNTLFITQRTVTILCKSVQAIAFSKNGL